jgi:hypothetical protein
MLKMPIKTFNPFSIKVLHCNVAGRSNNPQTHSLTLEWVKDMGAFKFREIIKIKKEQRKQEVKKRDEEMKKTERNVEK